MRTGSKRYKTFVLKRELPTALTVSLREILGM
jgi:hypothetical protein